MLIRIVIALKDKGLQKTLEKKISQTEVRVECIGHSRNVWQNIVRSCGDIIIISEDLILSPVEQGLAYLNSLPENPTTVILHESDSSEEHAQLAAAGGDVVLFSGISQKSLLEAIESTIESRRQYIQKEWMGKRGLVHPKISDFDVGSEIMRIFVEEAQQVIPGDSPILLAGETGVGKEHLARAIHAESPRSGGPFVAINAAAVPEQLLESELFGHEQGAFTGAARYRRGAFELAHGGTIFLDEIGEMPRHLQVKLLRILQDYEVRPLGGENSIWVDVRVIAATNRDLEKEIALDNFRNDLYYRISVLTLTIPPLRQRKEDIPGLARRFISYHRFKVGREVNRLSEKALQALCNYDWPGNVRELMNVIERAMLLCKSDEITLSDLPDTFQKGISPESQLLTAGNAVPDQWNNKTLAEVMAEIKDQVEKRYIEMVLKKTNGRVGQAARIADIHPRALYNKMKHLQISKKDFKTAK